MSMKFAPFDSCVSCYTGDTPTVVVLSGEAEWIIGGMSRLAGLSVDEAAATFASLAQHEFGCGPGMVPAGRLTTSVRLCRGCAERNGVPAAAVVDEKDARSGKPVPSYDQPADDAVTDH